MRATMLTWNFKKSNIQESIAIFREQNKLYIYIRSVYSNENLHYKKNY